MKRPVLIALLVLLSGHLFAQGIAFNHDSWKEVLAKAKQQDKLVFVDVYTSWCGPCKQMATDVFPLKEVGEVFNAAFVNYKIDAEKGEGLQIAKEFAVKAYPTYLFVNGDGVLIYRSGSSMLPKKFLNEAAIALQEKHDPKPLAMWESEYNSGKRDKIFLMGYIKKRTVVKAPIGPILDELFPLLDLDDLSNKEFMNMVFAYDINMTFVPGGKFYQYSIANYKKLDKLIEKKDGYVLSVLDAGTIQYFNTFIVKNYREELLSVMLETKKKLMSLLKMKEIDAELKGLVLNYYKGTKNPEKLVAAARDYVDNGLMKLDIAGKIAADRANYKESREPYVSGKEDSSKVVDWASMQRRTANGQMIEVSYKLRDAAQAIYTNIEDPKILAQALEWAMKAESYFPHFSTEAVCAGLLLKIGQKSAAAEMMMKASKDSFIQGSDKQKLLLSNVAKLKNGETPNRLW